MVQSSKFVYAKVDQLGGAFHLYHVYNCFNKTWLHPAKVVDTTLSIQNKTTGMWLPFGESFWGKKKKRKKAPHSAASWSVSMNTDVCARARGCVGVSLLPSHAQQDPMDSQTALIWTVCTALHGALN